jgi:hypothetical protein
MYELLKDNDTRDVTPTVKGNDLYLFSVGEGESCAPVKVTFDDTPSRGDSCSWAAKLEAVCNPNWSSDYTSLASITYGFSIDASGNVTSYKSGDGSLGDCGAIIVTTFTNTSSGIHIEAYYIGCCDNDLNWVQTITATSCPPSGKTPPYNDAFTKSPPYYFGPPGTGNAGNGFWDEIGTHTTDYPINPDYPPLKCQ